MLLIVAIGIAFYVGIKATSPYMKQTANDYLNIQHFMDLELLSPDGFTDEDVEKLRDVAEIESLFPTYSTDHYLINNDNRYSIRTYSYHVNEEMVNQPELLSGRFPTIKNEIIVDQKFIDTTSYQIGDEIILSNEQHMLNETNFTIVGVVRSPLYLSIERGYSIQNGSTINSFILIPKENYQLPVYTHLYLTIDNPKQSSRFTDAYENRVKSVQEQVNQISSNHNKQWVIHDLYYNTGFQGFQQDADRIAAIGNVFPVVFFLIASLVSLTSMTRMIDQDRTVVGTFSSLGFKRGTLIRKYLTFALSASLIGSIIGTFIGFNLFPRVIFNAYGILYSLPDIQTPYLLPQAIQAIIIMVLIVTIPAYVVCARFFKITPAILMRPKAPTPGKRILLERIGFIWKRFTFIQKVTARNLFRYKKRLMMTVIGVAGCTALLITGFGLRDSIGTIISKQYNEIRPYDVEIVIDEQLNETIEQNYLQEHGITEFMYVHQEEVMIKDQSIKNIYLIVPKDLEKLNHFIKLKTRIEQEKQTLQDDEVIITEKLASLISVQKGDQLYLNNDLGEETVLTVGAVVENYVYHYIYMNPTYYEQVYQEEVTPNFILGKTNQTELSSNLIQHRAIKALTYIQDIENWFNDMIEALYVVVWVLIISAALLAFIVLFTLTNINIDERLRELATIKVLGFYDQELASYVYRENIILTILGTGLGVIMGIYLHRFVIITSETDMVMFSREISYLSYIYSIGLTLLFSLIVNLIMYRRLIRINMIDSLKNVE